MLKETLLKFLNMDSLIENITGYVETRISLLKIEIKEEGVRSLSKAVVILTVMAIVMLSVFMMSMAAAYKLGEVVGIFAGFAIVGFFYLVMGLTLYLFRNSISDKLEKLLDEKIKKKEK